MDFTIFLKKNILNMPGWRTRRKIVVIESDDWGSIRMPDKETYNILLSKGIRVDIDPYSRYDSLASVTDISALFEVLSKFRDINGNTPVITANSVVANPDFEKIRATNFQEFHYELFTETLKKYPNHSSSFELWKKGFAEKLFHPQFHGREHLNVSRWMKALRQNLPETRLGFDLKLFGISTSISLETRESYLAAFDIDYFEEEEIIKEIISEGLTLFQELFGYASKSFIAPNYRWPAGIEKYLSEHNIKYIQGQRIQYSPVIGAAQAKKIPHFIGQYNKNGQIYTVRNCYFEPSLYSGKDSVNKCLAEIDIAFRWRKPAIICSHRVNFIGSIFESNRDNNLKALNELLTKIQIRWPEVEFMTSDGLGDIIGYSKN